jgi:hypothetical protein
MDVILPLDRMTTAEKINALEAIWESLCQRPDDVPSPSWHADVLRNREQRVQDGSSQFLDWTESKRSIRDSTT